MFGMFGSAKVKAECLGDTLGPMQTYAGLNLHQISNRENFDLQEDAYKLLQDTIGEQKSYLELEKICATWLAILNSVEQSSNHTFSHNRLELENGFKEFLSLRVNDVVKQGMPSGLFSLIKKFL